MTNVKKAYVEIVNFLEENSDKKVKSILETVIEMASAKNTRSEGSTYLKDASGNVVAIQDYYFKRWMPLVGESAVEFGVKAKTATGFNSMCKEGVSQWTKQQREAKNASANLLKLVASGEVKPTDIVDEQAKIEETRKSIVDTELGFADSEALKAYLLDEGVELTA